MSEYKDQKTEELIIEKQPSIQAEMGHLQRIIGIFTKPQEVILDINRSPKVLVPMILISILTTIVTFMSYDVLLETTRTALINATRAQGAQIPLDGFVGLSQTMTNVTVLGSGIGAVIVGFIGALILHGISTFVGGEGSIKKIFSASLYIAFIALIGSAIAGLIGMVLHIDFFAFSPTVLLGTDQIGKPLYSILSIFNIFNIWRLVIMIMAVKSIEVFSTKKASIIVIGLTVLTTLISIATTLGK